MEECIDKLRSEVWDISCITDINVEGTIEVSDNFMLYTPIPYKKGWTVYVDGNKKEINRLGGGVCGDELEKESHIVTLKYRMYGVVTGVIMNSIGVIRAICILAYRKKGHKWYSAWLENKRWE